MDDPHLRRKPEFVHLLNEYKVHMPQVARAARVPLAVVRALAMRQPTDPATAQQVLDGLAILIKIRYTLAQVDIPLTDDHPTLFRSPVVPSRKG